MKVSSTEFAHTLRSMRPDLAFTIGYVERRIENLDRKVIAAQRLLKQYRDALKQLNDNPERFR